MLTKEKVVPLLLLIYFYGKQIQIIYCAPVDALIIGTKFIAIQKSSQ